MSVAYQLPQQIGVRRTRGVSWVVMLAVMLLGLTAAVNWMGWRLRHDPSLGASLHGFYPPWDLFSWMWTFRGPLAGGWPAEAYDALNTLLFVAGGVVALSFVAFVAVEEILHKGKSDVRNIADSAHWADEHEVEEEGLFAARSGPILGSMKTSTGERIVRYEGDGGIIVFAPSGGRKTTTIVKPNLLGAMVHPEAHTWTPKKRREHPFGEEPVKFILDIKSSLTAATSGFQKLLGDVYILDPLGERKGKAHFNPFHSLRINSLDEVDDCLTVAEDIVDQRGDDKDSYWTRAATDFAAACVAKLAYRSIHTGDYASFSLPGLVEYISSFDCIEELILDMVTRPDDPHGVLGWTDGEGKLVNVKPWILQCSQAMAAKADEERSGVYGMFLGFLKIYRSDRLRVSICESTFNFAALANDKEKSATVYFCVPGMRLDHMRPYIRMIVRAGIRELTERADVIEGREVRGNERSFIWGLDEVARLGKFNELEQGAGFMRGHGVIPWLIFQSFNQLLQLYGDKQSILENMPVHLYGRPNCHENAVPISQALGKFSFTHERRNASGQRFSLAPLGHVSDSTEVTTRDVMTPNEVRRLPLNQWVLFYSGLQAKIEKFSYYLNKTIDGRSKLPPVEVSDVSVVEPAYIGLIRESLGADRFGIATWPAPPWKTPSANKLKAEEIAAQLAELGCPVSVSERPKTREGLLKTLNNLGFNYEVLPLEDSSGFVVPVDSANPVAAFNAAVAEFLDG